MARRTSGDPSPLRSALAHSTIGFVILASVAGATAFGVNFFGDASDGSPKTTIALFDESGHEMRPALKARLDGSEPIKIASATLKTEDPRPVSEATDEKAPDALADAEEDAVVNINGRPVRVGQAYSEVVDREGLPRAPLAGLRRRENGYYLPVISESGERPDAAYARPFANPEGAPTVSIIVTGLGINRTHTAAAIEELPPEITLSFVPYAAGLQSWVNRARDAGHEVLIEVPMEALEYGRLRPHSQTLTVAAGAATNTRRLEWALSRASGAFGVVNQDGGRLALDDASAKTLMTNLSQRGVAFFENGDLADSVFAGAATDANVNFARPERVIDREDSASEIEEQLLTLEASAKKNGRALAAGFAYPVTIDTIKSWAPALEGKGVRLAPASYMLTEASGAREVTAVSPDLAPPAGDPAP